MAKAREEPTYEDVVLWILAYEFSFDHKREAEAKIKRRLRDKKLGKYDQDRVDLLRRFKDELQVEIGRQQQSKYFTCLHGRFSDRADFDSERMRKDFEASYPSIPRRSIDRFIEFAIYLYYLR